jgi:hypothetical protein
MDQKTKDNLLDALLMLEREISNISSEIMTNIKAYQDAPITFISKNCRNDRIGIIIEEYIIQDIDIDNPESNDPRQFMDNAMEVLSSIHLHEDRLVLNEDSSKFLSYFLCKA